MGGWMDDGWQVKRWKHGWVGRWVDGSTGGWMCGRKEGGMGGCIEFLIWVPPKAFFFL